MAARPSSALGAARVLIASPIPSHPQDQGNAARIHALGRLLQHDGVQVHFLYYPLEGLTPPQARAMAASWDALHIVPLGRVNLAPRPEGHHLLDDWYDPAVTEAAAALHARHRYHAVIANYVWFSGVLTAFGPETLKILDTHDVFGGRDAVFRAAGLAPEWFWTTPEQEAAGLARADIVLAIQQEEAAILAARGAPGIRVLGHLAPWRARTRRAAGPLTIGYLASSNPINRDSFRALQAAILRNGAPDARLLVAGALCDRLADPSPFIAQGRIAHVDSFYDQVDIVVNPMQFGTGLKIKSVEALFQGLPLIATGPAMAGLPATHRLHLLADADALAEALPRLAASPRLQAELAAASATCAKAYAADVHRQARSLLAAIDP